jgi:hypothetical protein
MTITTLIFSLLFSTATPNYVALSVVPASVPVPAAVLSGVVTDRTGKAIVGAEIRLINTETGATTSVRTNENGVYQFTAADPSADYAVAVRSIGFVPEVRAPMKVGTAETPELSFTLAPVTKVLKTSVRRGK